MTPAAAQLLELLATEIVEELLRGDQNKDQTPDLLAGVQLHPLDPDL